MRNNHFYAQVQFDDIALQHIDLNPNCFEEIAIDDAESELEEDITFEQDSIFGRLDSEHVCIDDECRVIERNILLAPRDIQPEIE